jgi:protease-4
MKLRAIEGTTSSFSPTKKIVTTQELLNPAVWDGFLEARTSCSRVFLSCLAWVLHSYKYLTFSNRHSLTLIIPRHSFLLARMIIFIVGKYTCDGRECFIFSTWGSIMSKKTAWIATIILLLLFGFFGLVLLSFYWIANPRWVEIRPHSVLEIYLSGQMPELPKASPLTKALGKEGLSILELRKLLRAAAKDSNIQTLYLTVPSLSCSWAQIEELRGLVGDFKKSKKPVLVRLTGDMAAEKEVYLSSLGDEIYLNTDAGLLINGLSTEVTFYKGLMQKLKVEPQFLQFKEFKSPEVYTREKMTPEFRQMLEGILKDIQERFLQTVAADRKISSEHLRAIIQVGMTPATVALKEKLVTNLGYQDDVLERLKTGKSDGGKEYRPVNAEQYLNALQRRPSVSRKTRIALLGGNGVIVSGNSDEVWGNYMGGETVSARLREIREDKTIQGVLFRVDSPGGSAVGSDKVWREVSLLEKAGKPVVVSMAGVAGSGGYYISMGARKIVAQPSTITGSIGVIFGKFNLRGLYEGWLGITHDSIKLADNADIFSSVTSLTNQQKAQVRSWMEDIYSNFVRKAAEGRKMKFEELEAKAHGRIYTGVQAKKMHLVDEVGGWETALSLLKKELRVPEPEEMELVLYPKPKSLWRSLMEGELFKNTAPMPALDSYLKEVGQMLETPTLWLLAPTIEIK